MIVIASKYLVPNGFSAWTFFPFVFSRRRPDQVLLQHERIHLKQQLEMLVFPFFVWYIAEFLVRWLQYADRHRAYKNISFEREAYAHDSQSDYLVHRSFWAFLKYLNT